MQLTGTVWQSGPLRSGLESKFRMTWGQPELSIGGAGMGVLEWQKLCLTARCTAAATGCALG